MQVVTGYVNPRRLCVTAKLFSRVHQRRGTHANIALIRMFFSLPDCGCKGTREKLALQLHKKIYKQSLLGDFKP